MLIHHLLLIFYFFLISLLLVFGFHRYWLLFLYWKNHKKPLLKVKNFSYPTVTIQLPVYNEAAVIDRLIESVSSIDYPKKLFQLQIIDDSNDVQADRVKLAIQRSLRGKVVVDYIKRNNRDGFKAGALDKGIKRASGEFIVIFDADFMPKKDFLKKTLPYFCNKNIGMIQTKWGHINRNYSLLTKIQALFIESHFAMEQAARFQSGRFFNFNGTAGIWRKECIVDSGGWQPDTLAEDLDLSYRAQLKGWKFIYLNQCLSYAEIPIQINAFKKQQQRWIQGTIQVAQKIIPQILKSKLSFWVKAESILHLTHYLVYPVSLIVSMVILPSLSLRMNTSWRHSIFVDIFLFIFLTFSVFFYHFWAQFIEGSKNVRRNILFLPLIISVSIGLSINNSLAVINAFFKKNFVFIRTPKFGITENEDCLREKKAKFLTSKIMPYLELLSGCYFSYCLFVSWQYEFYQSLFFLNFFIVGFFYVGILSFFEKDFSSSLLLRK